MSNLFEIASVLPAIWINQRTVPGDHTLKANFLCGEVNRDWAAIIVEMFSGNKLSKLRIENIGHPAYLHTERANFLRAQHVCIFHH